MMIVCTLGHANEQSLTVRKDDHTLAAGNNTDIGAEMRAKLLLDVFHRSDMASSVQTSPSAQ